ncbi:MAG: sulfatase family protein [Limisphaerales bacterium]
MLLRLLITSNCLLAFCFRIQAAERPNVLLFMADDLSWHDHGCYGNKDVRTPNIDGLAGEGMRFEHCYNSAPMCAPTRMSLYSGIHPVRNGAHPNHSHVFPHIVTWPHYFRTLGYRTAILGKRHEMPLANFHYEILGGRHHDNGDGIDLDLSKVRKFMTENKDLPWCLFVTSNQPHTPWNRGDASAYDPQELELPPYLVDTQETREGLANYYAEITYMDAQLGTCLKHLRETGQEQNTIVIYLSEQGSNFPHCKWTCYDSGLRSAGIVRWPKRIMPGVTSEAMIQYIDVVPTLLHAVTGEESKHDFDGKSFLDVLAGKSKLHRKHVFGIQTSKGIGGGPEAYGIRTIRDKRYRLIWNLNWEGEFQNGVTRRFPAYASWKRKADTGDDFALEQWQRYRKRPQLEFYDLQTDPYELENLAKSTAQQPRIQRMHRLLGTWMKQQGDEGVATELDALSRKMKRSYR